MTVGRTVSKEEWERMKEQARQDENVEPEPRAFPEVPKKIEAWAVVDEDGKTLSCHTSSTLAHSAARASLTKWSEGRQGYEMGTNNATSPALRRIVKLVEAPD